MNLIEQPLKAFTNWHVLNNKTIYDSITTDACTKYDTNLEVSLESVVTLESCIQLKKNRDEACSINLCASHDNGFKVLTVVSGSKYIEMFTGELDEYYNTFKAELLDDFEGTIVYKIQIVLQIPVMRCVLKFLKCTFPEDLWIYGLHVIFDNIGASKNSLENSQLNPKEVLPDIKQLTNVANKDLNTNNEVFDKDNAIFVMEATRKYLDMKFFQIESLFSKRIDKIERNQEKLAANIDTLNTTMTTLLQKLDY